MKLSKPSDFIGKTSTIAAALFAQVPRLKAEPRTHPLDRCFLFYGPPGTGKTSLAECLALALAENPLEIEQRNGQSTSVETIREWMLQGAYLPMFGTLRVKLIDEIDAMSLAACNEARTWLDKLGPATVVIGTTNRDDLQEQLRSRCQCIRIDKAKTSEIYQWLKRQGLSEEEAERIAGRSDGNVRAALAEAKAALSLRLIAA
jgi:DNA polymerase III delta prime subunit